MASIFSSLADKDTGYQWLRPGFTFTRPSEARKAY
jgi:hypothetical protein